MASAALSPCSDSSISSSDVEGWYTSVLRVTAVTVVCASVSGAVSVGDISICINVAFTGTSSGVGGGVAVCLGSDVDSKGEYEGVFTRDLRMGLSISAEAIRV